jgi:hypothetical protein
VDAPSPTATEPHPGYVSAGGKRKFTLLAGLVGFLFFLVQAIIPFFLLMAMERAMRGYEPARSLWPHVENAVYWNGSLWYTEESLPRRMSPRQEATLQELSLDITERKPHTACSLFMEDPKLLAGSDRLWIISQEMFVSPQSLARGGWFFQLHGGIAGYRAQRKLAAGRRHGGSHHRGPRRGKRLPARLQPDAWAGGRSAS